MALGEKIEQARQAGYKDAEIAQFLSQQGLLDSNKLQTARSAGYSDSEVLAFLQQPPAGEPVDTPERRALQERLVADVERSNRASEVLARAEGDDALTRPFIRGIVDLADGALGLPKLLASAPVSAYNLATGSNVRLPVSYSVADIADAARASVGARADSRQILAPRNNTEQLTSTITQGVGGVLGGLGVGGALAGGSGVAARVGQTLLSSPGLQLTGAVTGGLSSELARRAGYGAVGQTVAGIVGGVVPSVVAPAASAITRAAFRGGEEGRQTVARNIETFERAGTTPTVGQATERRTNQAAETLLGRLPGGAGPIARKAQTEGEDIAARIEQNASQLARRTSPETTGRMISRQIQDRFLPKFRAEQGRLYGRLDQSIPDATPTAVTNIRDTLNDMTRATAATSARLVNPRIRQMAEDLALDIQNGNVTYGVLRELRTRIGEQIDNGLVGDVPQSQWRRLYRSLSDDLRVAADAAGPQARRAFDRANKYTKAGHDRIEVLDDVVNKAGGGEAIFNAAVSGSRDGATKLRAVMRSLDSDGQKRLSATMLRRLGRAVNSQQDDAGGRFSTQTFLTRWNDLSPEARTTLFGNLGPRYTRDIQALARVASNIRDGSKVFSNTSGTGQAAIQGGTVGSFVLSLLTGRLGVAAGIAGSVAASNLAARSMTNPNFVRWLARSTNAPISAFPSLLNQLEQAGQRTKDPELLEAAELIKQMQAEQTEQSQQ